MQTDPPAGVSASPVSDNVMTWFVARSATKLQQCSNAGLRNAVIIGPTDTPFEDGTFRLVMHFEEQYPNKPPGVKFISQMFHPNVYGTGELCLDILQNRWSPTYDVAAILTSVQRLVRLPDAISNTIADIARQFAKRPKHLFAGKCRSVEPVQGQPPRVHKASEGDCREELGRLGQIQRSNHVLLRVLVVPSSTFFTLLHHQPLDTPGPQRSA